MNGRRYEPGCDRFRNLDDRAEKQRRPPFNIFKRGSTAKIFTGIVHESKMGRFERFGRSGLTSPARRALAEASAGTPFRSQAAS
jgi:hypothetical protein